MASPKSYFGRSYGTAGWTPGWREKKIPFMRERALVGGGAHADPRVLMEESRNITFAPESVRNAMRNLREGTGELRGMKDLAGVRMGQRTPLAGSAQARAAERQLLNVPEGNMGPFMHASPAFQEELLAKGAPVKKLLQRLRGGSA